MPDHLKRMNVLLIGSGYMAKEYAKVLSALKIGFDVIGRGEENCRSFRELYPAVNVAAGGLEKFQFSGKYSHAIIASSVQSLYGHAVLLLKKGLKDILLEKPGGVNAFEIKKLSKLAHKKNAKVLLAYNRRFYASILKAKELIQEDGGVLSFNFEFTEWPHTIESLDIEETVKQNWFMANSTHVADTAFYLGGKPVKLKSYTRDSLQWHNAAAIFVGAGVSESGALFSYQANWKSPGRWSVEILTARRRLILRPMEILQVQQHRSVAIEAVEIDDQLDKAFKPGLYLQTKAFLSGNYGEFCQLQQQKEILKHYNAISNY